ncbi:DNA recombination protein RecN [Paenibacillus darwinianus]|uniref:DNA repair protein RecN n=1 Tax=Paenibacillus darwinianus TaxID=1380763 RepID=A0A9W5S253_9BACL|nr:DNA repair protein RecN [Paenibacillus darwinianus]EXX88636.1 DNA recombination protein RecN [Paenibacillus darwinianus]EXX91527.1 DNA recombination protein RecN [Paenibacillus darwinianus]EXX91830.1 DNA recombination protein RecN [Paenibacillus darwinianus]
MLRELSIRNLAVIEQVSVNYHHGFHVLTGETGAGKSILIDALSLVIGGRGSSDMVRYGCDKAEIEALFDIRADHRLWSVLSSLGIDANPEEMLVVRRELSSQGKSVSRINGQIVNLSMLRQAGEYLVNIHGQHEHQSLLRTDQHLEWLDLYAGDTLAEKKRAYWDAYRQYQQTRAKLRDLEDSSRQNMQMLDLYRFQVEEIAAARLTPGEDDALLEEKRKLSHAERRMEHATEAYSLLYGSNGLAAISKAISRLEDIRAYDSSVLDPLLEQLQSAYYQAEDVAFQLRDYRDGIESNPERLAEIEDRIDLISGLKRKYGEAIPDILIYYEKIAAEADKLENRDEHLQTLREEERRLSDRATALALGLSELRHHAAERLAQEIETELKQLQMERTSFKVQLDAIQGGESGSGSKLTPQGLDEAVFMLSANPGEPLKPLNKIASGGEISRIMLAMKTIFAAIDGVPVLVFDEVDTGVSGRAAQAIAEKMSVLSRNCQVFSITHLPQVACMADHHYEIKKTVKGDRTSTSVAELLGDDRVEELARMLGGVEVTSKTRHHAQEMLDLANRQKGA